MPKLNVTQAMTKALSYEKKGDIAQAAAIYQIVLENFPNNSRAQLGLKGLSRRFTDTTAHSPPQTAIDDLILLFSQKKFKILIETAQSLVAVFPQAALLWNLIGAAHRELTDLKAARLAYGRAIALVPDYADAHYNLGIVYKDIGDLAAAEASYQRALQFAPNNGFAHQNIGVVLELQGKLPAAIAAYKSALSLLPNNSSIYFNLGNSLKSNGMVDAAIDAYSRALVLTPDYPEAENNLGMAFKLQGKFSQAVAAYQRALEIKPNYADPYVNLGHIFQDSGKIDLAYEAYKQALILDPSNSEAECQMLHQLRNICNWDEFEARTASCPQLGVTTERVATMHMFAAEDCPERQLIRAQKWASGEYRRQALPFTKAFAPHKRLRIGYFSADFQDHPLLKLTSGLFREHDQQKFEIFAYSYSPESSDLLRHQLKKDVEHFVDIYALPDQTVVEHARDTELDIAIDMTGYTGNTRSHLFQSRLAPIQMNYLGYPGSMGVDFIDYIIGDKHLVPAEQRAFYTEKLMYLPHSYLPNDDQLQIVKTPMTRTDYGLPEEAFVLCCFNNNYKITPAEFDIWMRILSKIEGSVLWLREGNSWSKRNLCYEAEQRGIDPARLVFAGRIAHDEHLARYRFADIFVDNFNYNAHTTGSEALWAGLPVVTKQGQQFSARVGASLLHAMGLSALITSTEAEYEALILALARDPARLKALRQHIAVSRPTSPLFDTKRYTRNFERGLQLAYDLHQQGKPPQDLWITEPAP